MKYDLFFYKSTSFLLGITLQNNLSMFITILISTTGFMIPNFYYTRTSMPVASNLKCYAMHSCGTWCWHARIAAAVAVAWRHSEPVVTYTI